MSSHVDTPKLSVVIPTYNRCDLLRKNLTQLADQTLSPAEFEVVVADDGSTDATPDVVESFRDRLSLKYHVQEDRGFRAGQARNGGARLADGPLLVFLDTGTFVGRNFLRAHLDAHRDAPGRSAVLGYTYGYDPDGVDAGMADRLARLTPDELVARDGQNPTLRDVRHPMFAACDFDPTRLGVPWQVFLTLNCSVRADDFAAVGGFDEAFDGWGFEDCELGYRLHHAGVAPRVSRQAWAIESPHERDPGRFDELPRNMHKFFTKHPEPALEIGWVLIMKQREAYWTWEDELRDLTTWTGRSRDIDVTGELAAAARDIPAGDRVAVFGAGGNVPESLPSATLLDFDQHLLDRALSRSAGRHTGQRAIGLRTTLPDRSVDTVLVTSRLTGLWKRWDADILAEARRIGRTVRVLAGEAR